MSFTRWLFERPKIDYLIIILAFLFVSSNYVFEDTLLHPVGQIDVSYGSSIPQDTNYTITQFAEPSTISAIILNETFDNSLYFKVPIETLSSIRFDLTLQSNSNNTQVEYRMRFGDYSTINDVVIGTTGETFSFTPNINASKPTPSSWLLSSSVSITALAEINSAIIVHTEYSEPVCPITFDLQSTDGFSLHENEYTKRMRFYYRPDLVIKHPSTSYSHSLAPTLVNQSYYLSPGNYSCIARWGHQAFPQYFNLSVSSDEATFCIVRMNAVRLYLSTNIDLPLTKILIDHFDYDIYDDFYTPSTRPEFLYVPPVSLEVEIASADFFSRYVDRDSDVRAAIDILSNSNRTIHLDVTMPYLRMLNVVITPHDLTQIVLALSCFFMVICRLGSYFNSKRPRTTWKDPRLLPVIILFASVCVPWFSTVRDGGYDIDFLINMNTLGPIPLASAWIENDFVTIALTANGLMWSFVSLAMFWIPLLLVMFHFSTPSDIDGDFWSTLLLFGPFIYTLLLDYDIPSVFYNSVILTSYLDYVLLSIPIIWGACVAILWVRGKYNHGPLQNRLLFDVKVDSQRIIAEPVVSQEPELSEKVDHEPILTLKLVFSIIALLLFILPSAIGLMFERVPPTFIYAFQGFLIDNPLVGSVYTFTHDHFRGGAGVILLLLIIPYYWFTAAMVYDIGVKSRNALNLLLLLSWAIIPIMAFSGIFYGYHSLREVAWLCVSVPYLLLSLFAIWKSYLYVKGDVRLISVLGWIVLPIIAILPGGWILSLISEMQFAAFSYYVISWVPVPIMPFILLLLLWPLSKWKKKVELSETKIDVTQNGISE